MRLPRLSLVAGALLLLAGPVEAAAQSSIFGVRGLGLPGRPLTPVSRATGGSFALFDGESGLNPAAIATLTAVSAGFVLAPTRRHWESPAGDATLKETRFPLMYVSGPIPGSQVGVSISFGSYADRDFKLASVDTVPIRGQPAEVFDTLTSLGGLNEIRLASGILLGPRTAIGAGFHIITGSNRLDARRQFADSDFVSFRQTAELSYQGFGVSLGITHQLSPSVQLAATVRTDGKADVDVDSAGAYSVDLPYTFSAGARIQASRRVALALHGSYRTWSGANSDLQAQGGIGSRNTLELAVGGILARNLRRPANLPIRLGFRYAEIPFPITPGSKPREIGISAGTGTRFANDRAGIDLSLEQAWRSEGSAYKERAFSLVLGLSIRPYGQR